MIKEWLAEARVSHEFENIERSMARAYGYRETDWCDEDGHPTQFCGPQPDIPFWLYVITDEIPSRVMGLVNIWICRRFGHDIVDESSIGPESGTESFHCRRCGWDFTHIYY